MSEEKMVIHRADVYINQLSLGVLQLRISKGKNKLWPPHFLSSLMKTPAFKPHSVRQFPCQGTCYKIISSACNEVQFEKGRGEKSSQVSNLPPANIKAGIGCFQTRQKRAPRHGSGGSSSSKQCQYRASTWPVLALLVWLQPSLCPASPHPPF